MQLTVLLVIDTTLLILGMGVFSLHGHAGHVHGQIFPPSTPKMEFSGSDIICYFCSKPYKLRSLGSALGI